MGTSHLAHKLSSFGFGPDSSDSDDPDIPTPPSLGKLGPQANPLRLTSLWDSNMTLQKLHGSPKLSPASNIFCANPSIADGLLFSDLKMKEIFYFKKPLLGV